MCRVLFSKAETLVYEILLIFVREINENLYFSVILLPVTMSHIQTRPKWFLVLFLQKAAVIITHIVAADSNKHELEEMNDL